MFGLDEIQALARYKTIDNVKDINILISDSKITKICLIDWNRYSEEHRDLFATSLICYFRYFILINNLLHIPSDKKLSPVSKD